MIGNPFLNVILDENEASREIIKKRIRTFIAMRGTISLTEWQQIDNSTHELMAEVLGEIYAGTTNQDNV